MEEEGKVGLRRWVKRGTGSRWERGEGWIEEVGKRWGRGVWIEKVGKRARLD